MRTLKFLLQKEFKQIFRNKMMAPLIFIMPCIQLLVLPLAANYEIKNINLAVTDEDHSVLSQKLLQKILASGYFKLAGYTPSYKQAMALIEADQADVILRIPLGFEQKLMRENNTALALSVNAINGVKAGVGSAYLNSIIRDFNNELRLRLLPPSHFNPVSIINIEPLFRFNPLLNYRVFMVPGILALLLTMIGGYLTALNIVKEKEVGTIEQINVTPIKKYHFILGKLIPFWILSMIVLSMGLLVSYFAYHIVPAGNLWLIYAFAAIYLPAVMGMGLVVSTYADTQQQAMFIAFFFMMIFIMLGGLFTPIESMPYWAQLLTRLNPISYLIEVMRMIVLKGSTWSDVSSHFFITSLFAIGFNIWAVINYKKTT